jgi:hypothetical protein
VSDVFIDDEGALWTVASPHDGVPATVLASADPKSVLPIFREYSDELLANTMVVPETLVVTADAVVLVGGLRSGTLRGIPEEPSGT